MKLSLGNCMLIIVIVCFALAWLVDHRAQIAKYRTLENNVHSLRTQLNVSHAGNALTQGYLNFFRIEDTDGFTADDYRNQLNTLKREYARRFPRWAVTQSAKIENGK